MDTKTPESKPDSKPFNFDTASSHLKKVKEAVFKFEGKPGYNPYLWWAKHGADLETQSKVDKSEALANKILTTLKFAEPKV